MATKLKSFGPLALHLSLSSRKRPSGMTFMKSVGFSRLFEKKVGKEKVWFVEIEAKKLRPLAVAGRRIVAVKKKCSALTQQITDLEGQASNLVHENKALLDRVTQLTADITGLENVNAELRAIIERGPEMKLRSDYRGPLADAASKANTAWPLPGHFEGGRRR